MTNSTLKPTNSMAKMPNSTANVRGKNSYSCHNKIVFTEENVNIFKIPMYCVGS